MLVYYVRYIVCHVGINEAREGTVPVILVPRGCQNEGGGANRLLTFFRTSTFLYGAAPLRGAGDLANDVKTAWIRRGAV